MKLKNKNTITFIIILIVSLFVAIPSIKMNIQYDDGIQHVCRLIGTERSIKEGNIIQTLEEIKQELFTIPKDTF